MIILQPLQPALEYFQRQLDVIDCVDRVVPVGSFEDYVDQLTRRRRVKNYL